MASIGKTAGKVTGGAARGLRRLPQYTPPEDERNQPKPTREERRQRRAKKYSLFSLGMGLDMPLFIFIMVLLAIGLVMLFSASYAYSYYNEGGNSYYYIQRQGMFAVVGVIAMLAISTFDYHRFHRIAPLLYGISVLLLIMVLAFKGTALAPMEGDANRWLKLGIRFQPSEVAKFAVITLCAHYISQHIDEMGTFRHGVAPFLLMIGLPAALIYLENHLSATIIIFLLGGILMFLGGTKFRYFGAVIILAVAALGILVVSSGGYQLDRIYGWLDPFNPPEGIDTWQTRQSLYAIGSGGLLGVGLGQSRQKYLYLPEPQNDFIFAIVCEELGMVGALVVIILFSLLIWRGMYVSLHAKDKFGMLLGLGITFQVGIQAVLNICVVTNTLPNTGISLPFFSYGGTALLMLLGEMGVLLNISRSASVEKT
ncbi:FtsW/RodA/SpoVE family cell cycle protein [uncultured Neglectibacter sp.]|uniref:FtsW/RodA/SpoVE family cell cycle protein n=1 Tax=uncultured Neglectibacter sp. TaxID=1924108 RepID=UPI0034DDF9D3